MIERINMMLFYDITMTFADARRAPGNEEPRSGVDIFSRFDAAFTRTLRRLTRMQNAICGVNRRRHCCHPPMPASQPPALNDHAAHAAARRRARDADAVGDNDARRTARARDAATDAPRFTRVFFIL